ncbi:hypothetical protein GA0116948_10534 [Chitinophaga costaii]|uniref:DoxX family protein n=1 Tax=Chitinophaga costaii TaxID=1335309 RepID=A0A1C4D2G1_9BACT|nr:hypothetical protein [Chitinophaga costaii]PUZ24430.1 hypothetical protein DCM91_10955 [Chitinophaga costaii]SCC25497.1 hypothetical protein GA0116948_10534 [Chitinophaga costaii]
MTQTIDRAWTKGEKFLFRVAFAFFLLLIFPLDLTWYDRLFHPRSFFWILSSLAGYRANFITLTSESARWGIAGYATWGAALLGALIIAGGWTFLVRKNEPENYNRLYYWLRVVVRYRIALGIIAFGFLKFYPMQMPPPAISNLETDLGDYNTYKLYWQQVGVSIWYEVVLGLVEIVGGILLFFRGTTALGAVINIGVLGNIAHANLAYDGAVHVYSSFFVLLSLFILVPYVAPLWKLLIKQEDVSLQLYRPAWKSRAQQIWAHTVKYVIVFFFTILYGILRYDVHFKQGNLKDPITPGLAKAAGVYNVTTFKLNGQDLPYSPLDSVRWSQVIFEKWSTLVYKVHKPFAISLPNGDPQPKDVDRSYELAGVAGGNRFLYYRADTANGLLYLQDKAQKTAWEDRNKPTKPSNKTPEKTKSKEEDAPQLVWHFTRQGSERIILSGLSERKDSIYAVLDRVPIDYPLQLKRSQL